MDKGEQRWNKLVALPQEYEPDPSIAQRVIEECSGQQGKPKRSWLARKWKALTASAVAAVLALGIGIPLYVKLSKPTTVYYAVNEVTYEKIENTNAYVAEKGLDILYFGEAAVLNARVATIIETGEIAFIEQDTLHIGEQGFDKVNFYGVAKKNAKFNFYTEYEIAKDSCTISGLSVIYDILEMPNTFNRRIVARFSYKNKDYFLDIVTEQDGLQQLEVYINMLLA